MNLTCSGVEDTLIAADGRAWIFDCAHRADYPTAHAHDFGLGFDIAGMDD